MVIITEEELRKICLGLREDREKIIRYNPIGTPAETMLWMLLSVLISYLSLKDNEMPCFTGVPTVEIYRHAISFILEKRRATPFDVQSMLDDLIKE